MLGVRGNFTITVQLGVTSWELGAILAQCSSWELYVGSSGQFHHNGPIGGYKLGVGSNFSTMFQVGV